jgi:predicted metal-dependent phosphoesterase TrpH
VARHVPPLTLRADAAIDLQLHTAFSDGNWLAEELLAYVAAAGFALVAVTDHDRMDTVAEVQRIGAALGMPVLAAAELSATWEGQMLDLLCYGFDPRAQNPLATLAEETLRAQAGNIRATYAALQQRGYRFPAAGAVLGEGAETPGHLTELIALMKHHGYTNGMGEAVRGAGFRWIMADPAAVAAAAHRSDAVCLVGHPGRGEGFVRLDAAQLDRLRAAVPIDGLEVEHPSHTPEQVELFREYARRHDLLMSTGSDSHGPPRQMPIKYRAEASRALLERVGIRVR